jgi:hypothetical protein
MSGRVRLDSVVTRISLQRRRVCQWLLLPAGQLLLPGLSSAATVASARIWPAQEYTRLILESASPIAHQMMLLKDPQRLVLDLEGVEPDGELAQLVQRLRPNDPHIQSIRLSRFRPGIVRLVLDLKDEVQPQIFASTPVGEYGYRLVLDIYPLTPPDPLMALLEGETKGRTRARCAGRQGGDARFRQDCDARPVQGRAGVAAAYHHRTRSRTWRRRSGRDRSPRHPRKGCDARHRAQDPRAYRP